VVEGESFLQKVRSLMISLSKLADVEERRKER